MNENAMKLSLGQDATDQHEVFLLASMANRHGLVCGATGTGKTVTLQTLAEQFSQIGVPVFLADVKGDLSGLAQPGEPKPKIQERLASLGVSSPQFAGAPVMFWDLFAENGLPIRTTISEMGPVLLSKLLGLSTVQEGILQIAFKLADEQGLLLLDLKDLKSLLLWMSENQKDLRATHGNVSSASVGAIQRGLLELENAGGERFFGEPALDWKHLLQTDFSGRGVINLLDARKLVNDRTLYSTFLLWLLSELFENMEEVGDLEKPKFVFFFDEAHLLFNGIEPALLEKIEMVVRLIRSKGVGVYFVTQSPADVPDSVLSQLGNRVQHCLRAYTPKDQKAVRVAAQAFRSDSGFDVEKKIVELGIGEALISTLDAKGAPQFVSDTLVRPPLSRLGPCDEALRSERIAQNPLTGAYKTPVDRESAFEILKKRKAEQTVETKSETPKRTSTRQSGAEAFLSSFLRSAGTQLGRQIMRGIMGSLKK